MLPLASIERELDPFSLYSAMRHDEPVYFDPQRRNWNVFHYDDVQRVLSDYGTFSSQFMGDASHSVNDPFSASMISSDPPRHRQLRTLVSQAFTPRAVDALAPRITNIVAEHLDGVMAAGRMDVIEDLGYPLPVIVIAEMLGIPPADREKFKLWSDIIVSMADYNGNEAVGPGDVIMEMGAYFLQMIEKRRQDPGEDLLSGLLAANIDGERLSLPDLMGFCALLLVAGNETTTNLIGNAILCFADHPEVWERLRIEPNLLPQAIEEVLRFRSPVQSMFRVTAEETTLSGKTIPAGVPVTAWIGSANRDETQFPAAEMFDIERSPNRHLAFGQGIHYCLGAPLARLEAKIALGTMLERFKTVSLDPKAQLERLPSLLVYGVRSLPVDFSLL